MKYIPLLALFFYLPAAYGQQAACHCDKNTDMNSATVSCDTTVLDNGSKLYWQYNCDRIWLTLENTRKEKYVIDEVSPDLYGYTYRLGFHLEREYRNSLLFRSGCPANGPCIYTLVDKSNGKELKTINQLIGIDVAVHDDKVSKSNKDYIVYLSDESDSILVYAVDAGKTIKVPFEETMSADIPQRQFGKMEIKGNILVLSYEGNEEGTKILKIKVD
jgi:hypothetical protein